MKIVANIGRNDSRILNYLFIYTDDTAVHDMRIDDMEHDDDMEDDEHDENDDKMSLDGRKLRKRTRAFFCDDDDEGDSSAPENDDDLDDADGPENLCIKNTRDSNNEGVSNNNNNKDISSSNSNSNNNNRIGLGELFSSLKKKKKSF